MGCSLCICLCLWHQILQLPEKIVSGKPFLLQFKNYVKFSYWCFVFISIFLKGTRLVDLLAKYGEVTKNIKNSDQDSIFLSQFWNELFTLQGMVLNKSF